MAINRMTADSLASLIIDRGKPVLERFNQVVDYGIKDPKFLAVLQFVKEYWNDSFRPALSSFCSEAVGGDKHAADDAALMITLIAVGGGIHDDIIDRSTHKHFRMTVVGLFGTYYSLLIGDYFIIKGWAMAQEIAKKASPKKCLSVIEAFGEWTSNICEAEFTEISFIRSLDTELSEYERVYRQSMADTRACAKIGAITGGGSNEQVQALADYASELGFLFRLANDLGDLKNMEGNLSLRLENESVPLPVLYAAKTSKENYQRLKAILSKTVVELEDLSELLHITKKSNAYAYSLQLAQKAQEKANKKLAGFEESAAKEALASILDKAYTDIVNHH